MTLDLIRLSPFVLAAVIAMPLPVSAQETSGPAPIELAQSNLPPQGEPGDKRCL
ncbi:hypothetical protein SAMN04488078_10166 [Antarctobacter heliothermus]|uniref:Uncharacterized protein n=1 Tax=Antarctobacter heliothermus TaxID=74033 RepID=A0A239ENV3_9RHOB|nr:hypothetical protein SAMN04488078_10166 [Antarctobacter heliothermus]